MAGSVKLHYGDGLGRQSLVWAGCESGSHILELPAQIGTFSSRSAWPLMLSMSFSVGIVLTLEKLGTGTLRRLQCDCISCLLFEDGDQVFLLLVESSHQRLQLIPQTPIFWLTQEVVKIKTQVVVDDFFAHPLHEFAPKRIGTGIGAFVGFPISSESGDLIGSVGASHTRLHKWSEAEIALMRHFSKEVAKIIN